MFLLRIFREKRQNPPARRAEELPTIVTTNTTTEEEEGALLLPLPTTRTNPNLLSSFSSSLLARDDHAEFCYTAEEDAHTPILLYRTAQFLEQAGGEGELDLVEISYQDFLQQVCKETSAVSWTTGATSAAAAPLPLLDLVRREAKPYLWIDSGKASLERDMKRVFAACGNVLVYYPENDAEQYFASKKTLVQRLCRECMCGADFAPPALQDAMLVDGHALFVDASVQAQWGVRTAKSMTDLQLSSTAESPEETALNLVCEQVLERYPVLFACKLGLVPLHANILAAAQLCLRLRALYEWYLHPDAADGMWNTISVPPHELKLTLMALIVQKIGEALQQQHGSVVDDSVDDLLWEMETMVLSSGEEEEAETEAEAVTAEMRGFGALIHRLWTLLLRERTTEECSKQWLAAYLLWEQTKYVDDDVGEMEHNIEALLPLFHLKPPPPQAGSEEEGGGKVLKRAWRLLCDLADVFQPGKTWLEELSEHHSSSPSSSALWFASASTAQLKKLPRFANLPSSDPRMYGVCWLGEEEEEAALAPESMHLLFGNNDNRPDFLLGFVFSELPVSSTATPLGLDSFSQRLHAAFARSFISTAAAAASKPPSYGLFISIRFSRSEKHEATCVMVRAAAATYREEWLLETVTRFTAPFNADGGGMREICSKFAASKPTVLHAYCSACEVESATVAMAEKSFMSWPVREDGQRRTTFRPAKAIPPTPATAIVADVEDSEEKTSFDWESERPRLDKAFAEVKNGHNDAAAVARYHAVLQRNYVHETEISTHLHYFAQLCEQLVHHLDLQPALLDLGEIGESLDFLCEDMKDALDLAREDGEEEDVLDEALVAFRKLQAALRAGGGV